MQHGISPAVDLWTSGSLPPHSCCHGSCCHDGSPGGVSGSRPGCGSGCGADGAVDCGGPHACGGTDHAHGSAHGRAHPCGGGHGGCGGGDSRGDGCGSGGSPWGGSCGSPSGVVSRWWDICGGSSGGSRRRVVGNRHYRRGRSQLLQTVASWGNKET